MSFFFTVSIRTGTLTGHRGMRFQDVAKAGLKFGDGMYSFNVHFSDE